MTKRLSYFVNITDTLPITAPPECDVKITSSTDHVLYSIQKYRNHPSIIRIKDNLVFLKNLTLIFVAHFDVWNEINQHSSSEKSSGDVPTDILKLLSELCVDKITLYIKNMFEYSEFPDQLKLADVSPICKANDSTLKLNFRPISILLALSKVFERIMANANTRLSSLLCGFCNGYSTQHAFFCLIVACRSTLDKKG